MKKILPFLTLMLTLLAACAPDANLPGTVSPFSLIPYSTATVSPTPELPAEPWAAEAPPPSATPFTYTVVTGDTLLGIALKFGVRLEDLQTANPTVQAQALSPGTTLRIPTGSEEIITTGLEPTPVPLQLAPAQCHPAGDGGLWCVTLAANPLPDMLENVAVQMTLYDGTGTSIATQAVFTPLNILPAGAALPLLAYFPAPIPSSVTVGLYPLSGIRLLPNDARYLAAAVRRLTVSVQPNGRSAQVRGQLVIETAGSAVQSVWMAAVAYDSSGAVTGLRRWESNAPLPGGALEFEITVAAFGGDIERVDVVAEVRPILPSPTVTP